jgi:hypothetical protein
MSGPKKSFIMPQQLSLQRCKLQIITQLLPEEKMIQNAYPIQIGVQNLKKVG